VRVIAILTQTVAFEEGLAHLGLFELVNLRLALLERRVVESPRLGVNVPLVVVAEPRIVKILRLFLVDQFFRTFFYVNTHRVVDRRRLALHVGPTIGLVLLLSKNHLRREHLRHLLELMWHEIESLMVSQRKVVECRHELPVRIIHLIIINLKYF